MALGEDILARYDVPVPRYTSYPTAPQFSDAVSAEDVAAWYAAVPSGEPLSLYIHVPYCDTLCWFCGCTTKITRRAAPVAAYLDTLLAEIELVAGLLGPRRPVAHVHFGGGSPTILSADQVETLTETLRQRFAIAADAEIAVEIDPRGFDRDRLAAWAGGGLTRASLGVQDTDPAVQRAVNRVQSPDVNRRVVRGLREAGIGGVNVDLMYGLPRQNCRTVERTADHAIELGADRIAIFGYAHVPWMKSHQKRIDEDCLPGRAARRAMRDTAARRLSQAGYRAIGLDHFARPGDPLAKALDAGNLHRNFQGYTADPCGTLIGLGASAIGSLPSGYVQNEPSVRAWRRAIEAGVPAVVRGLALSADDRLRRTVIERLMCDFAVDVEALAHGHGTRPEALAGAFDNLAGLAADGLCEIDGWRIRVPDHAEILVRNVAAAFDAYHLPESGRHARAV